MKATKIISACAVLVALASCSNDHVISQPGAEDTPIRIQANVGAVTTKAAYNLLESTFSSGDAINVYIGENTSNTSTSSGGAYTSTVYSYTGSTFTTTNTQYFPANGNGIDVWGVYPSTVNESSTSQDFSIKNDQTSDADYKASDLMFATELINKKKNDQIRLTFAHQLSKIIVKLAQETGVNANLTDAVIKLTNVSTKVPLTKVDNTGITLGTASTDPQYISELIIGKYEATNGTAAIVIPQSTTGMSFKVELVGGGTYTASMPASTTDFVANKAYTFNLTLKANGINVSADIAPWTSGTGGNGDATLN